MANSVDPVQTAPSDSRSGSTLFAYAILSDTLVYEILAHLLFTNYMFSWRNKNNNMWILPHV